LKNDIKVIRDGESIRQDISACYFGYEIISNRAYNNIDVALTKSITIPVAGTTRTYMNVCDNFGAGCLIKGNIVPLNNNILDDLINGSVTMNVVNDVNPDPSFNFVDISNNYKKISLVGSFDGIDFDPTYSPPNPFTNKAYEKSAFGALAAVSNKLLYQGKYFKASEIVSTACLIRVPTNVNYGIGANYNPNVTGSVKGATTAQNVLKSGSELLFTITLNNSAGNPSTIFNPVNLRLKY